MGPRIQPAGGDAVYGAVGLVEQMGELVDAHVVLVAMDLEAAQQVAFRQHHQPAERASRADHTAGHQRAAGVLLNSRVESIGINKNFPEHVVFEVRQREDRYYRAGGHQEAHGLVDLAADGRDGLLGQEYLSHAAEPVLLIFRQPPEKRHALLEYRLPLRWNRLGKQHNSPPHDPRAESIYPPCNEHRDAQHNPPRCHRFREDPRRHDAQDRQRHRDDGAVSSIAGDALGCRYHRLRASGIRRSVNEPSSQTGGPGASQRFACGGREH